MRKAARGQKAHVPTAARSRSQIRELERAERSERLARAAATAPRPKGRGVGRWVRDMCQRN